jgi:hypothetical protein
VPGVLQARVRAQRTQERLLEDVLGVLLARQLAGVDEQLVAVGLHERPERGQRHGHRDHSPVTRECPRP